MFRSAWTIGRIRGVPLRLHVSLLLIIPVVAWSLATRGLPQFLHVNGLDPSALVLSPAALGVILSILVFVGVGLHELGHALVALAQGARVRAITLMVLGGVTEIEHEEATPSQTFWMAIAGPLVSVALAALGLALGRIEALPLDVQLLLVLFGWLNLFVAAFNMIPALPLDGGRILKALLQWKLDEARATRVAAGVGRAFAVAGGIFGIMRGDVMLIVVSAFVFLGSGAEEAAADVKAALVGLRARQAMATRVTLVPPHLSVAAAARHMLFHGAEALLVHDGLRPYGALLPDDLKVGRGRVDALLTGPVLRAEPEDPLEQVVSAMRRFQRPVVVYDASNAVMGIVTLAEVARAARLRKIADRDTGWPTLRAAKTAEDSD